MVEFSTTDFAPLDDFPLLWRWTQLSHDLLDAATLATIRPLTAEAAAAIAPEGNRRCSNMVPGDVILSLPTGNATAATVAAWLAGLAIAGEVTVIVSWSSSLALVTCWSTFAPYWDAFWYPSSDDVTVWAPTDDWTLCYRHFEELEFRRGRPAT